MSGRESRRLRSQDRFNNHRSAKRICILVGSARRYGVGLRSPCGQVRTAVYPVDRSVRYGGWLLGSGSAAARQRLGSGSAAAGSGTHPQSGYSVEPHSSATADGGLDC